VSIAALIQKPRSGEIATATVATDATQPLFVAPLRVIQPANVATVASVAVAKAQNPETAKTDGVIGKLAAIPTTVASVATVAVATLPDAETATHHTWLVTLPTGERFSAMYAPPKTAAEIQARYPDALVEREPDPAPAPSLSPDALEVAYAYLRHIGETDLQAGTEFIDGLARDPEQLRGLYADVVKMGLADWPDDQATDADASIEDATAPKAVCARCSHWRADTINPSGGLGHCLTGAPASRRPGSCWPWLDAEIRCREFQA
jgi:hypothetical protein